MRQGLLVSRLENLVTNLRKENTLLDRLVLLGCSRSDVQPEGFCGIYHMI